MRYALLHTASATIRNIVEFDGAVSDWTPPPGHNAVADPEGMAQIGGTYANGVFSPAPPPPPESAEAVATKDADAQMLTLRTKARAVYDGTDTFTNAQVQKILAGLVLRETREVG